jgi:HEAT repeat protein
MFASIVLAAILVPSTGDPLKAELVADDPGKAVQAAQKLGAQKHIEPLLEALSLGVAPRVAGAILDALSACKSERATDAFLRYADNRNADLRKRALAGLFESSDRRAGPRLVMALGDIDGSVRATAAKYAAKRRDKGADEALFKLLERGDPGAAAPLGWIANAEMTRRLAERIGSISDALLAQTLGEVLKRSDVADPLRVEVVRTLGKIPGADATTALVEYVAQVPEKQERPSKTEAQKVIEQRGGK